MTPRPLNTKPPMLPTLQRKPPNYPAYSYADFIDSGQLSDCDELFLSTLWVCHGMARVPLINQEDLPEDYQYLMSEDALGEPNIFRAMGNNPKVMQSYMRYGTTLWNESGLTFRERELAILAAANALSSEYEWHQHVHLGRDADISADEMKRINRDDLDAFDGNEQALIRYARAFAINNITDRIHDEFADHYDTKTVVGTTMLSSHYIATAAALEALDVPLEEEFIGWDLENE